MKLIKVDITPLTVNKAWQGRRFKTDDYKNYKRALLLLLPSKVDVPDGEKLALNLEFGVSSKCADIDNPIKPVLDILQEKYGFNDRIIYRLSVVKVDVPKGSEYIKFKFTEACYE